MLSVFALSGRMLARPGRANNFLCCVEHARRACSTQHKKSGERRRRKQALVMEIRPTLSKQVSLEGGTRSAIVSGYSNRLALLLLPARHFHPILRAQFAQHQVGPSSYAPGRYAEQAP
jgi:hypothetical protein